MNIVIVGCGKVGATLAEQLNEENNNITVIDTDAKKVREIAEKNDIMGIIGNGATYAVQTEADVKNADLFIAVTGSDELNLLCCMIAKKAGDCKTIARIKNPQYSSDAAYLQDELGLAMVINTEQAAASEIARILRFPSAIKIDTFAKGRVELVKFRLPDGSPLVGMAVKDMIIQLKADVLVCTVERGSDAFIAKGDFVFEERDVISIIASHRNANDFFKKIGYRTNSVKRAMVVGGGEISQYLCDILSRYGIEVKLVEKNEAKCHGLASRWADVKIINGDPADKSLLLEEGLAATEAFVALENIDEENILLSLYAKSVSNCKIITKINRIDFDEVVSKLELDSIVKPKGITADVILSYVRSQKKAIGSNVEAISSIIPGKVEVAEFIVNAGSPMLDTKLSQLHFREDVLIAAIIRNKNVILPRGNATVSAGDSVIVVSKIPALHDISDILA